MLASNAGVFASAKKVTEPDIKTVTRTISIPKTKVIKQPAQQTSKPAADTQFELLSNSSLLKSSYPINKSVNKRFKMLTCAHFPAVDNSQ